MLKLSSKTELLKVKEIIIPNEITPYEFKIEKLWDIETGDEIPTVNPGKAEQKVKIKLPILVKDGTIIRKKKQEI